MDRWNLFGTWRRSMVGGVFLVAGMLLGPALPANAETTPFPAAGWDAGRPKVSIVTNGWVDVREILHTVASNANLGLQLAPDVEGPVNVHLVDVPVSRALDALLSPADLGYEVVDDVLVVYGRSMMTRWFTFDYPVTEREGRGELEVSVDRAGSTGAGGGGGEGGENQNRSHVTSTAVMSVWPSVMSALETLVFAGVPFVDAGDEGDKTLSVSLADDEGRSLLVNPMASLVQVTAEWERVQKVEQLLERLKESLQRQVAVEVRIMEVILSDDMQSGVNWAAALNSDLSSVGLQTLNATSNLGEDFLQFKVDSKHLTGMLQAIASSGDLRTVSTPRVTTLNNQKAIVRVVREDVYYLASVEPAVVSNGVATEPVINYTPISVPIGVVLDVTPQVGRDRMITLNVHPTISDVVGIAESPNLDTAPILSIRELDTVGKVADGETLIIAGLISERTKNVRTGVPFLKDLPLLGYLFGKTDRQSYNIELIMLLTPVIMEGENANAMADAARAEMEERM